MHEKLKKDFQNLALAIGIQSIGIKGITAILRFILIAFICRNYSPENFVKFTLFLGINSLVPFFDLGIGGIAFRKKILDAIQNQDDNLEKKIFFSAFFRLAKIYFFLALVVFFLFSYQKLLNPVAISILFLRAPFCLPIEWLFANLKMRLAYGLEIVEQTLLLSMTFVIMENHTIEIIMIFYSALLLIYTIIVCILFLTIKKWFDFRSELRFYLSKEEIFAAIQAILVSGFLVYIPIIVNNCHDPIDTYEFNIGFRFISIGLGSALVLFNPIFNKVLYLKQCNEPIPVKTFILFLLVGVGIAAILYFLNYENFFFLLSGLIPENHLLHHYLFLWSACIFIFLGLDQLIKAFSLLLLFLCWIVL